MKIISALALFLTLSINSFAQTPIWKPEQIMSTKELADKINSNAKDKPLIFNMGPMENIKTATAIGRGTSVTGIEKLKSSVAWENKNRTIVVYCGCCSFASCPNIKPAYDALISAGFKNTKVLDLPVGIKPDWVAKGYPMEE
ncbi:MAG: rhodanese-like domain-containing protein [Bacteroidia bacterium]|nr:rhodanese-like domain-containing protein [Bacteroidia bacterium]